MQKNEWDDYAAGWDEDEAAQAYARAAYASLAFALTKMGASIEGVHTLDFGCGTGLLSSHLAKSSASILGVDTSKEMLNVFNAKIRSDRWAHVKTSDVLPSDGEFDLIVCSSVCSFLDDYSARVKQLAGLLSPGGIFVQWDWELNVEDEEPHGLSRDEIRQALSDAGFDDIKVDAAFEVPVGDVVMRPLMGIARG